MILRRYTLKTFLSFYLFSAGGFVGLFLLGDFFDRVDNFLSRGTPITSLFLYYIYKIPFILFYMAPQSVLLATVLAISSLSKTNEIIAMKACGISITRITLPIIGASLVVALLVIANSEFISPTTSQRMNHIYYVEVRKGTNLKNIETNNVWHKSKTGAIWNVGNYDPDLLTLESISIFLTTNNHQGIEQRIDAKKAVWVNQQWEFMDGTIRTFGLDGLDKTDFFEKKIFVFPEIPSDFITIKRRPEEMSLRYMYAEILEHQSKGKDVTEKWLDLNYRLSYPFIGVVLALIGIPLSLRSSRQGGLLFSVAINLGIGVAFSFFYAMCVSMGRGGTFDPVFATWGPIVLFTAIGFYLLLTIDSEKPLPFSE
jgi:lipopolysaccharide export system permease protein